MLHSCRAGAAIVGEARVVGEGGGQQVRKMATVLRRPMPNGSKGLESWWFLQAGP